jgi:hypothetical protein
LLIGFGSSVGRAAASGIDVSTDCLGFVSTLAGGFTSNNGAWGADRSDGGSTQPPLTCAKAGEPNNKAGMAEATQTRFHLANMNVSINLAGWPEWQLLPNARRFSTVSCAK